jgi:DNA-binding NarL/FixJ family response regulator
MNNMVQLNIIGNCFKCGKEFRRDDNSRICLPCRRPQTRMKALNPQLTFREKQVVGLVARGKLNKEIAYELHLSEGTIKEYLNRIFRKLGATNRTELAVWELTRMTRPDEQVA